MIIPDLIQESHYQEPAMITNAMIAKEIEALLSEETLQEPFLIQDDADKKIFAVIEFIPALAERMFFNRVFMRKVTKTNIASSYIGAFSKASIKVCKAIFFKKNAHNYLSILSKNRYLFAHHLNEIAKAHETMAKFFVNNRKYRTILLQENAAYRLATLAEKHQSIAYEIINTASLRKIIFYAENPGFLTFLIVNSHREILDAIKTDSKLSALYLALEGYQSTSRTQPITSH